MFRFPVVGRSICLDCNRRVCLRRFYSADFDDSKLRQIIETSNMGMAHQLEKQKQEIDQRKKEKARLTKIERNYRASQRQVIETLRSGAVGIPLTYAKDQKQIDTSGQTNTGTDLVQLVRARLSNLRETLTSATKTLNDLTGYTSIEKLKSSVDELESELKSTKGNLKLAKSDYTDAIQRRSDLQKEINELLTRKHNWTPADLERFTELYRNDHQNQQDEKNAEIRLEEAEQAVDAVQVRLTQLILTRYHEEQIWSDKIRQVLTWGTWMLMGVNALLFAVATFFVEPWKRRRLVDAFHHEVQQKLDEFTVEIKQLSQKLDEGVSGGLEGVHLGSKMTSRNEFGDIIEDLEQGTALAPNGSHPISFGSVRSWSTLQAWVKSTIWAFRDPNTQNYYMEKVDLGILSAILFTVGGSIGAVLTYFIVGHK